MEHFSSQQASTKGPGCNVPVQCNDACVPPDIVMNI